MGVRQHREEEEEEEAEEKDEELAITSSIYTLWVSHILFMKLPSPATSPLSRSSSVIVVSRLRRLASLER